MSKGIGLDWAKQALKPKHKPQPATATATTTAQHWDGIKWRTVEFKAGDLRYRKGKFYSYEKAFRYNDKGERVSAYKRKDEE